MEDFNIYHQFFFLLENNIHALILKEYIDREKYKYKLPKNKKQKMKRVNVRTKSQHPINSIKQQNAYKFDKIKVTEILCL